MKNKNKTLQQKRKTLQQKRRKRNKTHKNYKCAYSNKSIIIQKLMEMLNIIKLYHWRTNKYSHHVATDDLYETEMISSDIEFIAQQSFSQTSVLVSQDANKSGLLAILQDDITYESSVQSSQLSPQTITPQVEDRSY